VAAAASLEAGPVERAVLQEMAAGGGLEVTAAPAPGCGGPLRLLRGGRAAPGRPAVVLLHGRGHAASLWFPCWPPLAERHLLLAPDLPGFGCSGAGPRLPRRAPPEAAVAFFADPVEAVLRAEVAAGRASAFALVGHSLGGLVALELALRGRLPVSRLALIDGMGLGPEMTPASRLFFRLHPELLAALLGRRLFQRLNPSAPTDLGRRIASLEHELLTASRRPAAARAFDLLCPLRGPAPHLRDRLPSLAVPALLIWGERDAALPVANADGAAARLPQARLLRFPAGHSPHLDAAGDVLPALRDFLSG
jgi:pimeloyl-ACP methyl ester carboxylesterase